MKFLFALIAPAAPCRSSYHPKKVNSDSALNTSSALVSLFLYVYKSSVLLSASSVCNHSIKPCFFSQVFFLNIYTCVIARIRHISSHFSLQHLPYKIKSINISLYSISSILFSLLKSATESAPSLLIGHLFWIPDNQVP